jgi:hypothetical protein
VIDFADPEPIPVPVTTIAWRLAHLITGAFGSRAGDHFGGPPMDYYAFHYAGTAARALTQLDEVYAAWLAGRRSSCIGKSPGPRPDADIWPRRRSLIAGR